MSQCQNCQQLQAELDTARQEIKTLQNIIWRAISTATDLAKQADRNLQQGEMGKGAWGHYEGQLDASQKILAMLGQPYSPRQGRFITFKEFNR